MAENDDALVQAIAVLCDMTQVALDESLHVLLGRKDASSAHAAITLAFCVSALRGDTEARIVVRTAAGRLPKVEAASGVYLLPEAEAEIIAPLVKAVHKVSGQRVTRTLSTVMDLVEHVCMAIVTGDAQRLRELAQMLCDMGGQKLDRFEWNWATCDTTPTVVH